MGTAISNKGGSPVNPLVPTFVDEDSEEGITNPLDPTDLPIAPPDRPPIQPPPTPNRYQKPRSNFTKFASSGGSNRRYLKRAISQYVSEVVGGSVNASRRMGPSRTTASELIKFLNSVYNYGIEESLRNLDLNILVGRSVEEIFIGLEDSICPDGGSIDEGIARHAFYETMADLINIGITNFDNFTVEQLLSVFKQFVSHAIIARIYNDIGIKGISMPSDVNAVESIQNQLFEFIQGGVNDAINQIGVDIGNISQEQIVDLVTTVYETSFEFLEILGKSEDET